MTDAFIRNITVAGIVATGDYPFSIPAVANIEKLSFDQPVTMLVGENGSGKSTIIEAIAVAAGFNAEGGSKSMRFETRNSTSQLSEHSTLVRGSQREKDGFFLRAEGFYNVASFMEHTEAYVPEIRYGDKRMHEQSHGESFLELVNHRFHRDSLFILDEPEAALSPQRILALMAAMKQLVHQNCQFIISTHSPILMAYPDAQLYELSQSGIKNIEYGDIESVALTKDFLNSPGSYLRQLFVDK